MFGALAVAGFGSGQRGRDIMRQTVGIIVLNLLSVSWPGRTSRSPDHIGGLVVGSLCGFVLFRRRRGARAVAAEARCMRSASIARDPGAARWSTRRRRTAAAPRRLMLIDEAFGPQGPIAGAAGFEARPGQVQMAQLIERGILESVHTIVEAGTGVGKSLAYLVPALRSGKKVVDLDRHDRAAGATRPQGHPARLDALGIPARVELLKGRNHYLCRAEVREDERRAARRARARDGSSLWTVGGPHRDRRPRRTRRSRRAATIGKRSTPTPTTASASSVRAFADCWFFKRRDAARFADIVVVNHALFFLDLAAGGTLLPAYDIAILDEAHQCEKYATAALTATLSRRRRPHDAPAAPHLRRAGRFRRRDRRGDAPPADRCWRAFPGERYPVAANEERARAAAGDPRSVLPARELGARQLDRRALRRPSENEAEAERRRDLALRADDGARRDRRPDRVGRPTGDVGRVPADERDAITWVERGEREGRYEVNAAPFEVAEFPARHACSRVRRAWC